MIETEHRGYKVTFNEEGETWECYDLKIGKVPKLATVKRRIDEILKSERKVNVAALTVSRDYAGDELKIKAVTVTVLCEPERIYGDSTVKTRSAWVRDKGGSRSKMDLDNLFPLTSRSDIDLWMKLDREAQDARQKADAAFKAIPRHDADSLMLAAREAAA